MANRRNFYYRQLVTDGELDQGFNELEKADRFMMADFELIGVARSATLTEHSPSVDLTLDVSGGGLIYDQQGRRISIPSLQVVNIAVDSNAVSTAVVGAANEKWISVFAKFKRVLSDSRIDGNSNPVFFVDDESFEFVVVQGTEAAVGVAARPALLADGILLGDARRVFGDTTVNNSKISSQSGSGLFSTTRRQDAFVCSAGVFASRAGTPEASDQAIVALLNTHSTGAVGVHPATAISNTPAGAIAATTVQAALNELDTEKVFRNGDTLTNVTINDPLIGPGGTTVTVYRPTAMVASGYVQKRTQIVTASATIGPVSSTDTGPDTVRVGTVVANINLTMSAVAPALATTTARKRVRITRMRSADAFTITILRNDTTQIAVIAASAQGWVDIEHNGTDWVCAGFSQNVTVSLTTD